MQESSQLASLIEPVARALLGEPNRGLSSRTELRFGNFGSVSVDLQKGTWYDHETSQGGGTLDLIERQTGLRGAERFEWLESNTNYRPERPHQRRPNGDGRGNGADRGGSPGRIVATYAYADASGQTLFEVVRYEPKTFRQRAPKPGGGYSWTVRGITQVPYRLHEVLEAIANDQTIYVVEGEKDVDRLCALGVPATCNAGGAGKWPDELNGYFQGADVVVIPDYDPQKKHPKSGALMFHDDGRPVLPGQDHAQEVAGKLAPIARCVRVLELWQSWPAMPLKGDIADWLDAGGTPDRLYALAGDVPIWSPGQISKAPVARLTCINVVMWDGQPVPERRWLVHNRIPSRNVTLLSGEGGVGKSLIMQQLAVATVLAKDWIGAMPQPGPVIFVTAEDDEDELHFRLNKIVEHYGASFRQLGDLHLLSLAGRDAAMGVAENRSGLVKPTALFDSLRASADHIRPAWIGIDTAADVFMVDERDRSQVRQCISLLRGLALDFDTAVVLLSHPSLTGISTGTGLSGSTAWNNSVRSRLYLKSPRRREGEDESDQSDDVRVLEIMKANYGPTGEPIRLIWKDGLLRMEPGPTSMERIKQDADAQNIFLALLDRYNKQDLTVSANPTSRNFAPKIFADMPEAKALSDKSRKKLLREAMDYLLTRERIYVGKGPRGVTVSRQAPCLYAGGTLL